MRSRVSFVRSALALAGLLALWSPVAAQDFRGSILGTVTDSTGAVLPGVTVTIQNVETRVSQNIVTDAKGQYQVRYLNSGTYSVTATLSNFKTFVRQGVEVRVGDVLLVDVTLEPGGMEEVLEVKAITPILDTTSGVTGQVIDSNQIRELPLADGTAYMLSRLAPGVVDSSDLHFSRPMDNGNMAGVVVNGVRGGNDFTLDGAPNRVSPNNTNLGNNSGVVGFSPPSDAISEFKVQTNAFDAQAGQTAGASINLALKSGTNRLHGWLSYYNRDASRSETPLLTQRANGEKPTRTYNRYTGTLTGPIVKDKTFFMVSYEHLRDVQPEPSSYTVPTALMRSGNLSEWLPAVQIYEPFSPTTGRTPIAGNIIPSSRINPISAAYISYYPLPNRPGREDNYFTNQLRPYDYNSFLGRIDHNFNSGNKLFLTAYFNKREEDRYNWAKGAENATGEGEINGFLVTQGFDYRSNTGAILGFTSTLSSDLLLDVRVGLSRFGEYRDPGDTFDPASLGFSADTVALMNGYQYLPFIAFGGFSSTNANSTIASLGSQRSDWTDGFDRPFYNLSFAPTLTRIWGSHTIRLGYDFRSRIWDITNNGYQGGRFSFRGNFTRANNSAPQDVLAQSWAQFLLGIPTSETQTPAGVSRASQFEIAAPAEWRQLSHGIFLQDDWRVNRKLTLNLGVRLEIETAMSEGENRALAGFDRGVASPIEAAAQAAYARSPIPQVPVSEFDAKGGILFADGPVHNTLVKPQPRGAFSYLLNDKTVLRGGVGLFSYPYYLDAGNQAGFSIPTPIQASTDNGATFNPAVTFARPLPSGTLVQPTGSAAGLSTSLGLGLGTIAPSEREAPYYTRWQASIQRDLGAGWMAELMYTGSRGNNLPVQRNINAISPQYLTNARARDLSAQTILNQNVANPFQGLLPGSTINGAQVQRRQLLRPFPQFLDITSEDYIGTDRYNAGTIRLEKRFAGGNSLTASYTRSRLRDKLAFLNAGDAEPTDRISPDDRPNRVTVGASLRLPFGRGRRFGSDWNSVVNAVFGGWQISGTYQYQTGFPLGFDNLYYDPARDPQDLTSNIGADCANGAGIAGLDCPAWDLSGFYFGALQANGTASTAQRSDPQIALADNVRYFPSTLEDVRSHDLHLLDMGLYKNFSLPNDMSLKVRVEAINALNYTVLWNPGVSPSASAFGFTNQDRNNPRDIQLGATLTF